VKALVGSFSIGRETWDRLKSKVFRRAPVSPGLALQLCDIPEPLLPSPLWVRIRTVMSGISDIDEGMFLHGDSSAFGAYLSFPFVPGNENLGIVTEVGSAVKGLELGERVIVNPLLPCLAREIHPPCPSCSAGNPTCCMSFASGHLGPGTMIGACRATCGGWGDSFVAHISQVRQLPENMDSDTAVLIPEFARALRAVLQHGPVPGEKVLIVGARPLGLLTILALRMLDYVCNPLVLAEHAFEADLVHKMAKADVIVSHGAGTTYDPVAQFLGAEVHYPEAGSLTMSGGADLVYETTGLRENVEDALRFTGEGKRLVLMGMSQTPTVNISPVWFKGSKILGSGFSGLETLHGKTQETFDVALDMVSAGGLPVDEILTHRFRLEEYGAALAALHDRRASEAMKVVFQHVM
jgi:threonine dehydrogenase-like Zn-dependent dehydrogenase